MLGVGWLEGKGREAWDVFDELMVQINQNEIFHITCVFIPVTMSTDCKSYFSRNL